MLRLVDRYILREVIPPFLLGLVVFSFLLEIPPIMQYAESLIAKGVPWNAIGVILLTLLPQALSLTIPIALLIGLLVGLGRLSADRELVALQACGVSLLRLFRPVALLSVAACLATAYVMIVALPDANQRFREITYDIVSNRAAHEVKPRVFFEDFPQRVLYVRDVIPGGGWRDVLLADTQQAGRPTLYLARRGTVHLDRDARLVQFVLEDGTEHRIQDDGTYRRSRFERLALGMDADAVFPRHGLQRGHNEMSLAELREAVAGLRAAGVPAHAPVMAMHQKFSVPVACLVFGILALVLGVSNRKDGKLASFALGIAVVFGYYVLMYLAEAMAKAQTMPAEWARWVPNLVLGPIGVGLLIWRSRRAEGGLAFPVALSLAWPRRADPAPAGPGAASGSRPVKVVIRIPPLRLPRPNILDWYVAKLYFRVYALAFVGMIGIFYISTFIDLSDKLFKGEATGWQIATYFWYATPKFIYFVMPIAALVAALVAIGLLTKTSELTVMKACGISLYRIALPLVAIGALWSAVLFGLEESILAHANRQAEALNDTIRGRASRTLGALDRRWLVSREGDIYHYAHFDRHQQRILGLSVYEFQPERWDLAGRTDVETAAFINGAWIAGPGWRRTFGPDGEVTFEPFESQPVVLEPPDYFSTDQPDAELMTYSELREYIAELRASGFDVVPYVVDLHRKLSFPLVTIIMTLIAVPFAVTTGRKGALYGVGLGVVIAITYWSLLSVFGAIGSAGMLAPLLAAWAPNLLFGAGAAWLLLTVRT
jgi:LPS export ABC transporter permease LptG/LPS export ABC transporter permease LptF